MAVVFAVLLPAGAVFGAEVKNGGVEGGLVSASVEIPAFSAATVFTTPSDKFFVLTTACGTGLPIVSGGTFGFITTIASENQCVNFNPGYALPKDEAIICTNLFGGSVNCSISGVLTKK